MMCADDGLKDSQEIARKFLDEMDWSSDVLTIQLERCDHVIRALQMIRQNAKLAA